MTATTDTAARAFVTNAIDSPDDRTNLLVAADWYAEQGDELREAWCRLTVEVAEMPDPPPEPQRGDPPDRTLTMLENLQAWRKKWSPRFYELTARLRDLEAALAPSWPCKGCAGEGVVGRQAGRGVRDVDSPCPACGVSGDVLRWKPLDYEPPDTLGFPLTFAAGHVAGVTLPRLGDAVRMEARPSTECPACHGKAAINFYAGSGPGCGTCGNHDLIDLWQPTPRLRALCSPPPWGVPLAWVFAGDREPSKSEQHQGWFRWFVHADDSSAIPKPIYDLLEGEYPESEHGKSLQPYWRTSDAARRALAAAIVEFGRK